MDNTIKKNKITSAVVIITDIETKAKEMVSEISDTNWLNSLRPVEKKTFEATSKKTIKKLVNEIFKKDSSSKISEEFGEYLISITAQQELHKNHNHKKIPLVELLKEKISGNPGFDFHTETTLNNIAFGESKYSGSSTTYQDALSQIVRFINEEKDQAELLILEPFLSETAINNFIEKNEKAYVAAFSINAKKSKLIMKNAEESEYIASLSIYPEIYLIGIIVDK